MNLNLDNPLPDPPVWDLSFTIGGQPCPVREMTLAEFNRLARERLTGEAEVKFVETLFIGEARPPRSWLEDDDNRDRLTTSITEYLTAQLEKKREAARQQVRTRLDHLAARAREQAGEEEAAIFAAHQLLVDDPELDQRVRQAITAEGRTAAAAVAAVTESFAQALEQLDDEYLRGRAADVRDVGRQLLAALLDVPLDLAPEEPSVIVAHDLAPSDTARWPRERVLGLVTEAGGATSHVAILARGAGVPAVAGAAGAVAAE